MGDGVVFQFRFYVLDYKKCVTDGGINSNIDLKLKTYKAKKLTDIHILVYTNRNISI